MSSYVIVSFSFRASEASSCQHFAATSGDRKTIRSGRPKLIWKHLLSTGSGMQKIILFTTIQHTVGYGNNLWQRGVVRRGRLVCGTPKKDATVTRLNQVSWSIRRLILINHGWWLISGLVWSLTSWCNGARWRAGRHWWFVTVVVVVVVRFSVQLLQAGHDPVWS